MAEERIDSDEINPPPTALSYGSPHAWESKWGKGFLAACGCFVLWGLGQWIAGYRRRGIFWLAIWVLLTLAELLALALPRWTGVLFVLLPLQIALFLAMMIDAFVRGRKAARPMLGRPIRRYVAGGITILIGLVVSRGTNRAFDSLAHRLGANTVAITTQSMRPTLQPGDRIISHRDAKPSRWDLVVFRPPGRKDVFTQRVVGLPDEKVEIVNNQLFIDDRRVSPPPGVGPYVSRSSNGPLTGCEGHPVQLSHDDYFLLGDNSPLAYDSRCWPDAVPGHALGAVPSASILGRVTTIYWPPRRIRQFFNTSPASK